MNLNWVTNPLTIYAVLTAGGFAFLYLVVTMKLESGAAEARTRTECAALRELVAKLEAKVDELSADMAEIAAAPSGPPSHGLNVQKRSEALRMYRRGSDPHTVGAALGLSEPEAILLRKVHHTLAGTGEETPADS